jgi:hypothetical protein
VFPVIHCILLFCTLPNTIVGILEELHLNVKFLKQLKHPCFWPQLAVCFEDDCDLFRFWRKFFWIGWCLD